MPLYRSGLGECRPSYAKYGPVSTDKTFKIARCDIRINPQASDRVQGDSLASRKKHAFESASLIENLQNPARMHVIVGSEHRVTTTASLLVVTRQAKDLTCKIEPIVFTRRPALTANARTTRSEVPGRAPRCFMVR